MSNINLKDNTKKGFTLVEVVVALGIFSMLSLAIAATFGTIFKAYKDTQAFGENVKNAQFAMNLISKTLRTSTIVSGSGAGGSIIVFDYSRETSGNCIRYVFSGDSLYQAIVGESDSASCNSGSFDGASNVSMIPDSKVSGRFVAKETFGLDLTKAKNSPGEIGKVTMALEIERRKKKANLQTSVSLRDYSQSNVGIDVSVPTP